MFKMYVHCILGLKILFLKVFFNYKNESLRIDIAQYKSVSIVSHPKFEINDRYQNETP